MIIYKIENKINKKIYIGQTIKTFNERYSFSGVGVERVFGYLSFREMVENKYNKKLYRNNHLLKALLKYGIENFTLEIIDVAETKEELNEKEIKWIKFYNSKEKGYNKNFGGNKNNGWKPNEETRKLWSDLRKGVHSKEKNPNYNKKHSDEIKIKMSQNRKGKLKGKENPKAKAIINLDTFEIFETITMACIKYGFNSSTISNVLTRREIGNHGIRKTAGGFRWMYLEEYNEKGDIIKDITNKHFKKVINITTGKIFNTIKEASKYYELDDSSIAKVCKGKQKTCGGYKWSYYQ